jgi:hypothetical protein
VVQWSRLSKVTKSVVLFIYYMKTNNCVPTFIVTVKFSVCNIFVFYVFRHTVAN